MLVFVTIIFKHQQRLPRLALTSIPRTVRQHGYIHLGSTLFGEVIANSLNGNKGEISFDVSPISQVKLKSSKRKCVDDWKL